MNKGKFVIVTMVAIGLAMAVFAWWARYEASQRVLERFGPQVAVAVRKGQRVELLTLSQSKPANESSLELLSVGDDQLYISSSQEIADAPGLIHARHHLLHEKGFHWDEPPSPTPRNWTRALRFTHDEGVATWILDFTDNRAFIVERKAEVGMAPIAPALKKFLDEL